MIFPDTEVRFISREVGYGVVAKSFIPKGTITWVLDQLDRIYTPGEVENMSSVYREIIDVYAYRDHSGNFVLCWDNGRFVNHSFRSNCLTTAYDFEIAVRDIYPGEQLTDDYGYLNIEEPFRGIDEHTRRKVVYPDDLRRYYKIWDKKIRRVFPHILKVDQPLRRLISEEKWNLIQEVASGKQEMLSIITNLYPEVSKQHWNKTRA